MKLLETIEEDFALETAVPRQFFSSVELLRQKMIHVISNTEDPAWADVTCLEIECDDKRLYLIYEDTDAWALGWGNSVVVVQSIDKLTPECGYYPSTYSPG